MSASVNIHYAENMTADAGGTSGFPLTIRIHHPDRTDDLVTFFVSDFDLSRKLAEAFNEAFRLHREAKQP